MRSPRTSLAGEFPQADPSRRNRRTQGSAAPALLLAFLLVLLVAATAYVFLARRYTAPPPITSTAELVDRQYALTLYVAGTVFVLAQLGLGLAIVCFRDRGQRVRFSRGNSALEIAWISATLLVFLGLGIAGRKAWADVRFRAPAPSAIQIEATTSQFVYTFRYPGPDGKFGMLDPHLVNAPAGNPLGLDPNDPAGKDDIVVPTLTVPVDREIELLLRSQDVVHNFFVRELRLQQDAVPGMVIPIHFTPVRIGRYDIVCTQLCGLGHNTMHSFLNVVSESDYESFLRRRTAP